MRIAPDRGEAKRHRPRRMIPSPLASEVSGQRSQQNSQNRPIPTATQPTIRELNRPFHDPAEDVPPHTGPFPAVGGPKETGNAR